MIEYGTNDARLQGTKKSSPTEYVENLRAMIQILQSWNVPKERIYVLSPPPLRGRQFEKNGQLLYTRARIEQFAMACIKLAKEEGVIYVDIYSAIMGYAGDGIEEFMADGLLMSESIKRLRLTITLDTHLGEKGHKVALQEWRRCVDGR